MTGRLIIVYRNASGKPFQFFRSIAGCFVLPAIFGGVMYCDNHIKGKGELKDDNHADYRPNGIEFKVYGNETAGSDDEQQPYSVYPNLRLFHLTVNLCNKYTNNNF
jgi:hypothetical protein